MITASQLLLAGYTTEPNPYTPTTYSKWQRTNGKRQFCINFELFHHHPNNQVGFIPRVQFTYDYGHTFEVTFHLHDEELNDVESFFWEVFRNLKCQPETV